MDIAVLIFLPDPLCFSLSLSPLSVLLPNVFRWDRATGLLADMWLAGLRPDCYSYSSAIHACAGAGRWEESMSLLRVRKEGFQVWGQGFGEMR